MLKTGFGTETGDLCSVNTAPTERVLFQERRKVSPFQPSFQFFQFYEHACNFINLLKDTIL